MDERRHTAGQDLLDGRVMSRIQLALCIYGQTRYCWLVGRPVLTALMFARNEQRTLPHRRHHHIIIEEALPSLSFTALTRKSHPTYTTHTPPHCNATPGLFATPSTPTLWLRYVPLLSSLPNPSSPVH